MAERIVSPAVFTNEKDESFLPTGIGEIGAAVIGLLNALLWPLLSFVLVPFAVFTLGFAALLMNGLVVWFAAQLMDRLASMASGRRSGWHWACRRLT